jgi:hypothetical protein
MQWSWCLHLIGGRCWDPEFLDLKQEHLFLMLNTRVVYDSMSLQVQCLIKPMFRLYLTSHASSDTGMLILGSFWFPVLQPVFGLIPSKSSVYVRFDRIGRIESYQDWVTQPDSLNPGPEVILAGIQSYRTEWGLNKIMIETRIYSGSRFNLYIIISRTRDRRAGLRAWLVEGQSYRTKGLAILNSDNQFKILTNFNNQNEWVAKKVHLVQLSSFELSKLVKILNWWSKF